MAFYSALFHKFSVDEDLKEIKEKLEIVPDIAGVISKKNKSFNNIKSALYLHKIASGKHKQYALDDAKLKEYFAAYRVNIVNQRQFVKLLKDTAEWQLRILQPSFVASTVQQLSPESSGAMKGIVSEYGSVVTDIGNLYRIIDTQYSRVSKLNNIINEDTFMNLFRAERDVYKDINTHLVKMLSHSKIIHDNWQEIIDYEKDPTAQHSLAFILSLAAFFAFFMFIPFVIHPPLQAVIESLVALFFAKRTADVVTDKGAPKLFSDWDKTTGINPEVKKIIHNDREIITLMLDNATHLGQVWNNVLQVADVDPDNKLLE